MLSIKTIDRPPFIAILKRLLFLPLWELKSCMTFIHPDAIGREIAKSLLIITLKWTTSLLGGQWFGYSKDCVPAWARFCINTYIFTLLMISIAMAFLLIACCTLLFIFPVYFRLIHHITLKYIKIYLLENVLKALLFTWFYNEYT